jgi:hypothetical protein
MPRDRVYLTKISLEVPVADGYLADQTQRRATAGAQLNPAGRASGAVHGSSRRWPALYTLRLL